MKMPHRVEKNEHDSVMQSREQDVTSSLLSLAKTASKLLHVPNAKVEDGQLNGTIVTPSNTPKTNESKRTPSETDAQAQSGPNQNGSPQVGYNEDENISPSSLSLQAVSKKSQMDKYKRNPHLYGHPGWFNPRYQMMGLGYPFQQWNGPGPFPYNMPPYMSYSSHASPLQTKDGEHQDNQTSCSSNERKTKQEKDSKDTSEDIETSKTVADDNSDTCSNKRSIAATEEENEAEGSPLKRQKGEHSEDIKSNGGNNPLDRQRPPFPYPYFSSPNMIPRELSNSKGFSPQPSLHTNSNSVPTALDSWQGTPWSAPYSHAQMNRRSDAMSLENNHLNPRQEKGKDHLPTAANAHRCVRLSQPITLKTWTDEEVNESQIPDFQNLVNFPAHLHRYRSLGSSPDKSEPMRRCVMCGEKRLCSSSSSSASQLARKTRLAYPAPTFSEAEKALEFTHIIPRQNKGLCTSCDVAVWVVTDTKKEIKWCKGCKNFRAWAAFGEKGLATKCLRCRERQREKYANKKNVGKENISCKTDKKPPKVSRSKDQSLSRKKKESKTESPGMSHGLSCLIAAASTQAHS